MYPWERAYYRSPPLRPCRSVSDKLRLALLRSNLEDFWALVKEGADINTRYQRNKTPLHLVIYWKKDLSVVKAVLSAGADPNAVDNRGHTPLHAAIHSNSGPPIIEALLNAGAEIETPDSRGRSPLMKCINRNNNAKVIRILLSAGANVKIKNLMMNAVMAKTDPEVIRLFIMGGASVNDSSTAFPPISYAVYNGDSRVVKLLLAAGARTDFVHPQTRCTLLHQTHVAGVAHELIQHGLDVNAVNNPGETPLHTAVRNDRLKVAITMIKGGADVQRLVQGIGDNCLHLARSRQMVKMLLSHGVDINGRNIRGWAPLHTLVRVCYHMSFSLFSRAGRQMRTYEVLFFENMSKCQSAVKEMLKSGADVNAVDNNGTTILELAIYLGNPKMVFYMIKHGVNVTWGKILFIHLIDKRAIKLLIREWVIGNVKGENMFDYTVRDYISRSTQKLFMYAHQCIVEIELMKVEKINCNNTVYHYLAEIAPKIKALRLCSHYKVNDERCKSLFPIYKNKISVTLNKCYKRAGMLDVLENTDVRSPTADGKGVVSLINDCKFAIAEFLSNNELVSFLLAMGMKVSKDGVWPKSMNCGDKSPPIYT